MALLLHITRGPLHILEWSIEANRALRESLAIEQEVIFVPVESLAVNRGYSPFYRETLHGNKN